MQDFITHPATVYALLGYGAFVSIGCILLRYLWRIEKDEAEKAEGAAKFFEDKAAALIKVRDECKARCDVYIDAMSKCEAQLADSKASNKALAETNANLSEILSRAYIRNAYGQLQRYDDWAINGDKKPKPRVVVAKSQPMTRAEYVRALLKEAAESDEFKNESWPMSALKQMDDVRCNNRDAWDEDEPMKLAVGTFNVWSVTKEGYNHWRDIAYSRAVRNFKPKTKWVK